MFRRRPSAPTGRDIPAHGQRPGNANHPSVFKPCMGAIHSPSNVDVVFVDPLSRPCRAPGVDGVVFPGALPEGWNVMPFQGVPGAEGANGELRSDLVVIGGRLGQVLVTRSVLIALNLSASSFGIDHSLCIRWFAAGPPVVNRTARRVTMAPSRT